MEWIFLQKIGKISSQNINSLSFSLFKIKDFNIMNLPIYLTILKKLKIKSSLIRNFLYSWQFDNSGTYANPREIIALKFYLIWCNFFKILSFLLNLLEFSSNLLKVSEIRLNSLDFVWILLNFLECKWTLWNLLEFILNSLLNKFQLIQQNSNTTMIHPLI